MTVKSSHYHDIICGCPCWCIQGHWQSSINSQLPENIALMSHVVWTSNPAHKHTQTTQKAKQLLYSSQHICGFAAKTYKPTSMVASSLPILYIMCCLYITDMKWTGPKSQEWGVTCPDLQLMVHTGSAAIIFLCQTPRYSFQVMRCKALRAPHDSAMVSCSLYLCSEGPKQGPFMQKLIHLFKPNSPFWQDWLYDPSSVCEMKKKKKKR